MDAQVINAPTVNTIYEFRTTRTAGFSYRVENRTPFTLYLIPESSANYREVISRAQITVLPMNSASLTFVAADYITVVLNADLAQISLPQDVTTFIRFITILQTENASEQQTNSAIAIYNPASLEVNDIPASEAIQSPPANTQVLLPSAGIDLYGWNGAYFTWDCDQTLQDSIYGFIQQSDSPSFATSSTVRYFAGSCGLIYIPRFLRYLRVSCVTSPDWTNGNLETSMRRTVAEISPQIQYRSSTLSFRKDYSIAANAVNSFYIPVIPPITRVDVVNNNANRLVLTRNGLSLDGITTTALDAWVIRPSKINSFYVECGAAFFLQLTNIAITSAWSCRFIATYGD